MNKTANLPSKKPEPASPFLNAAIAAAVALAVLPAAIFGAVRILHSQADASARTVEVEEATPKRTSAAERRAQRLEARKAKEAKAQNTYPEITMEKVDPYYDDFGMGYDGMEFNGPGMMPPAYMGGPGMMPPAYMGGPGVMPPAYMGGPGMMPAPNRGNFNGGGRISGAEMGFNNGFGRGRGGF